MKSKRKVIIFLGDGMADEPIAALNGKTPLQAANTPAMDSIAAAGQSGTLLTLPEGFPTSSDVANMSVLGCDLASELCGRGPLEAASQGIDLGPHDVCFRMNLVTVDDNGIMRDYSGGHVSQEEAAAAIDLLNSELSSDQIRFHCGVSYRNLLVLSGQMFNDKIHCDKPDDNHGNPFAAHLPYATDPSGEATVEALLNIINRAGEILAGRTANRVWPWSGGRAGAIHSITNRFGISAAVISAVDVISGLGRCMGMDVISVPGATGYIDTNYEGKADAAIEAIKTHDFVYLHVEAVDEVSHAQDLKLKLQAIEDFDSRLVARVMAACGNEVTYAVLPDHPVPLSTGRHTRTPVPVAICGPDFAPDNVALYSEIDAPAGSLGAMRGADLMNLLLGN